MGKYLNIEEAAALSGFQPQAIRRMIISVLSVGSKADKKLVKKSKKGNWKINADLLEKMVEAPVQHNGNGREQSAGENGNRETWQMLSRQMEAKDKQISKLQEQMSQLIERNREMNIMLHRLQERLSLEAPKGHAEPSKESSSVDNAAAQNDQSPTSFAQWAKRFR